VAYASKSIMIVTGKDAERIVGQLYGNVGKEEEDVGMLGLWAFRVFNTGDFFVTCHRANSAYPFKVLNQFWTFQFASKYLAGTLCSLLPYFNEK
jgi:hypothetical protein